MRRDPGIDTMAAAGLPPGQLADVGPLVERIRRRLRGEADEARIRRTLDELMGSEFAQARVKAYLPILLERRACELLQAGRAGDRGAR